LKISGLESILAREKGRWDGRIFYIDEYALIFLFSRCARCAQKRDCWEHELCILQGLIIQQEYVNLALRKKTRKGLAKRKKYAIMQAGK